MVLKVSSELVFLVQKVQIHLVSPVFFLWRWFSRIFRFFQVFSFPQFLSLFRSSIITSSSLDKPDSIWPYFFKASFVQLVCRTFHNVALHFRRDFVDRVRLVVDFRLYLLLGLGQLVSLLSADCPRKNLRRSVFVVASLLLVSFDCR